MASSVLCGPPLSLCICDRVRDRARPVPKSCSVLSPWEDTSTVDSSWGLGLQPEAIQQRRQDAVDVDDVGHAAARAPIAIAAWPR
jgi:hypothetical protein